MQNTSDKPNLYIIIWIILLSSAAALLFNYLNPEGLKIITLKDDGAATDSVRNIVFSKPIVIETEDAFLLFSKEVQFLDIRTPEEYRSGHIPNSMNLPFEYVRDAKAILESIPEDTPIVIYSNISDTRINNAAAEEIFASGYTRLYIFNGGIDEWVKSNYPVVR